MSLKIVTERYWLDFFERTDQDRNGVLCISELKRALVEDYKRTDLTDSDIAGGYNCFDCSRALKEMFRDIDKNGDGQITKEEFLNEMMKTERKTAVREAFKKIDKSGDGKLQRDEVAAALRDIGHYTEDQINEMIKKADKNGDGVLDCEEFEKAVY